MKYNRYTLLLVIFLLYLLPIIVLSSYRIFFSSTSNNWFLFSLSFFMSFTGACVLFVMICQWESQLSSLEPLTAPIPLQEELLEKKSIEEDPRWQEMNLSLIDSHNKQAELELEIKQKNERTAKIEEEKETLKLHNERISQDFYLYKKSTVDQLCHKDQVIAQLQEEAQKLGEQCRQFQQQVDFLENSEKELKYEIKTLLDVSKMEEISLIDEGEFQAQPLVDPMDPCVEILRRSIETASKMTGLGSLFRSKSLPVENCVLDLRCLCDSLSMENDHMLFLYSRKESKMLFVNQQVKNLLGWTPEKFVQIFPEIIQSSMESWRIALQKLVDDEEAVSKISFKSKEGGPVLLKCYFGVINSGLFRNHLIGVTSEL